MIRRSLTFRGLSFVRWLADDLKSWWLLVRHPLTYGRWHRADQRAKLRAERRVWIVAPEISQVYIAIRFAEELRRRRPTLKFLFSVQDGATYRTARREAHPDDVVTYLPPPVSLVLWRACRLVRPLSCVAVGRAPFYLYSHARKHGTPVAWIAAEASEGDLKRFRALWQRIDSQRFIDAIDVVTANTPADRKRLVALGFDPGRIEVAGPAKYDVAVPLERRTRAAGRLLARAGIDPARPVLLGGSLYDGEAEVLLDLYMDLKPRMESLALVLAPRNLTLAAPIIRNSQQRGLRTVCRSQIDKPVSGSNGHAAHAPPDVLVLDTVGDLSALYGRATVVFVGRSLTHSTGSNLMEPAGHGKPIVVGPHFDHFREVLDEFLAAGAVRQAAHAVELRRMLTEFLRDPELCRAYGHRACDVVTRNAGSLRRTVDYLERSWSVA